MSLVTLKPDLLRPVSIQNLNKISDGLFTKVVIFLVFIVRVLKDGRYSLRWLHVLHLRVNARGQHKVRDVGPRA